MKGLVVIFVAMSMVLAPVAATLAYAQASASASATASSSAPAPINQPLVNEGTFAVKLANSLHLTTSKDEAAAENALVAVGIEPRNGWISDYPMTPDIIAEVKTSTEQAAKSGSLQMARSDAAGIVDRVTRDFNLQVQVANAQNYNSSEYPPPPAGSELYGESPSYVDEYYYDYGCPVVTYYPPPEDYYWLYDWVPYPFWWDGYGFGGFFILSDFDFDFHHHHFSNHFRNADGRWRSVDPVTRWKGRAVSSLSAAANRQRLSRRFHSTGAAKAERALAGRAGLTRFGNRMNASRFGNRSGRNFARTNSNGTFGRNFTGANRHSANNRSFAGLHSFTGRSFRNAPSTRSFGGGFHGRTFSGGTFHSNNTFAGGFHSLGGGFHGGNFGGFHSFGGGGFHGGGFGGFHSFGGGFHGGGFGGFHGGGRR